jgi:hypothetical protein
MSARIGTTFAWCLPLTFWLSTLRTAFRNILVEAAPCLAA